MDEKETLKLCEDVVKEFQKDNIKEAFELVKPHTMISEEKIMQLAVQTIQQLEVIRQMYGKAIGYELIKKEQIKGLIRYSYILKNEKLPLRFIFLFYSGKKDWKLINLKWDDEVRRFFENESAGD